MNFNCKTCAYRDSPEYTGGKMKVTRCATCQITLSQPGNWTPDGCLGVWEEGEL